MVYHIPKDSILASKRRWKRDPANFEHKNAKGMTRFDSIRVYLWRLGRYKTDFPFARHDNVAETRFSCSCFSFARLNGPG